MPEISNEALVDQLIYEVRKTLFSGRHVYDEIGSA
jgi:hypothetical protein